MAKLNDNDKKYLLSLKPSDLTFTTLVSLLGNIEKPKTHLGDIGSSKPRYDVTDTFDLTPSEYFVKSKITTTVGKFLFNKYIIEALNLIDSIGYVDWAIGSSGLSKLEDMLAVALLNDKITTKTFKEYINRRDTLGSSLNFVIAPSFTIGVLTEQKAVTKEKNKLVTQHKKELDEGNAVLGEHIEKRLLEIAKNELKNDPGMELYDSGALGSFKNNYKNNNVIRGPVFNNITGKYDFVSSSLINGIDKKDIPCYGNSVVSGAYPKAVGTQVSGYFAKQILAALQTEMLDVENSDCGTKRYIEFKITSKNAKDLQYRYIIENGKLIELTPDVIKTYIGKTVKLRSPQMCIGKKICHHCAGNLFYKLGITNIGLTTSRVATTLTNLGMKKFHDSTIKTQAIELDDIFI